MRVARNLEFGETLRSSKVGPLLKGNVTTLQINMGKRCNQSCSHCHVGAGPTRSEMMGEDVSRRVVEIIEASESVEVVDITGGAPELNPNFKWLVESVRMKGLRVIDRCNLTVLMEDGMEGMAQFLADNRVEIVASMPCYTRENVDGQRGSGVFEKSIRALRLLNDLGYGMLGSDLNLDLVYNPGGAALPGPQSVLEAAYKDELARGFGISFDRLLTLVNMPICRFADKLEAEGEKDSYMNLLCNSFNPSTVTGLMCRSLVSVAWNGELFDCDFNQMLDIPVDSSSTNRAATVFDIDSMSEFKGRPVATASHCFGCTAGAGSSCQGALE